MIISGSEDGIVAISSPTTGMTVRVISDHKGAPITGIDVTLLQVNIHMYQALDYLNPKKLFIFQL